MRFIAILLLFVLEAAGKHIVLVSGDEEYRSEEMLPQLARILEKHHGFQCTTLFAIDPADGTINPNQRDNIPGLEALRSADLVIFFLRFRDLPDEQMKHIVDYLESGRPLIGIRTATHSFDFRKHTTYARYSWNNKEWEGGFGRQILGETWVSHHGLHGKQSTRGVLVKGQQQHPILRGIKDGDIWGPTDVYTARPRGDSQPLVLGQVLEGMKPTDPPLAGPKNDPPMPIAWTRKAGTARVFTTTMGCSEDLLNEGFRRLLVNAAHWALGMESRISANSKVDLVGDYKPNPFKPNGFVKGVKPASLTGGISYPPPGYTLRWGDDFNGATLDTSKWRYRTDVKMESAQRAENVSLDNGNLAIALKKEEHRGKQ